MKKAIIIVRTSTVKQEIDSQREEVIKYALSDGYTDDELEVIGDAGSSAIKLDERYLENIKKVYTVIESTPTIECVYAWAIDRIGRKEELLMNFKNFLISKKVNLKIKNPNLYLLEADGRVNSGAELAFSLFATMSKQEMEQKKERFKRAKARNKKEGKFNGGTTRFGYGVENGYFVVNKEEADIVRLTFEEYSTGNYSMQKLADELNSRGIKNRGNLINIQFIHKLLTTTDYIGEGNKPAILDRGLYERCEEIRNNQTSTLLTKESKTIHLATKLLKCKDCGTNYIANFDRYVCYKHRFSKRFTEGCDNNLTIRIDVLDNLLWDISYKMHQEYLSIVDESKVESVKDEARILHQKVLEIYSRLEHLKVRRERVIELYTDGITTKDQYTSALNKIVVDTKYYSEELDRHTERYNYLEELLDKLQHPEKNVVVEVNDITEKKKIVNKYIKSVYIERYEKSGTKIVINDTINYLYRPKKEGLIKLNKNSQLLLLAL